MEMEALGRRAARAVVRPNLLEVEARVLAGLVGSNQTQAQLARSLGMDSGHLARTVRRLTQKALIEPSSAVGVRKNSPALTLTPTGYRAAADAQARKVAVIQDYLKDEARLSRLFQACHRMSDRSYTDYNGPFIRAAEPGEFGLFLTIAARTLRTGYFGQFDERIEGFLAKAYGDYVASRSRSIFLVAEFQGELRAGLIAIPSSADTAHIPAFAVQQHYLGWGIGRALVEEAMPRLRKLGYSRVFTVAPRDPEGSSFFKHQEWQLVETRTTADFGPPRIMDEWQRHL